MSHTASPPSSFANRRAAYRLRYPDTVRPHLSIGEHSVEVIDISEQGIRFVSVPNRAMSPGQPFVAILQFRNGRQQTIFGSVIRVSDGDVAAQLYKGIEFEVLAEERQSALA